MRGKFLEYKEKKRAQVNEKDREIEIARER